MPAGDAHAMTPTLPKARLTAFGALFFCYFAAVGSFNPFAPLWFKELGFSTLAIGAIASLQAWSRVLAPYAWSWWGDHGGRRTQLIRLAALVSLVAALGLLWARGYVAVATCTLLLFLANGGVVPLSEASLAQHLKTSTGIDSARYGRVRMWGSLGFISAVLMFGALLQALGMAWFPVMVIGMYALLCVASWRLPHATAERHDASQTPPVLSVLCRPEVAWFFASVFFTVLAHTAMYVFFSLYLDALGYSKTVVGLMWAASVVAEIAFFWAQGHVFGGDSFWRDLFGRFEPQRWLQWAAALSVLRFAMTAGMGAWWPALLFAQLLHAFTFAAQHASCIVLVNRFFPDALRGRGQALYTVVGYGATGVIGGVAGGWLVTRLDFAAVFWAAAVMALLGWGCARAAGRHAHTA